MKNLNKFGVQELNASEVTETNGGIAPLIIIGIIIIGLWPEKAY